MSFELLVGPPGAGKTTEALRRARAAAAAGRRVWWVGLPAQRAWLYRRATREGALLGLEFLTSQQVYYRLLAHALQLKPLLVGTGRLALVGEALLAVHRQLPAPGEARLFAVAIAEAKRYGLAPADVRPVDEECARFARVFAAYERLKGERWDYDDFRSQALRLAQEAAVPRPPRDAPPLEADLIVVDGFRELGPLELNLYRALSRRTEVLLTLPQAPPGLEPDRTLAPRPAPPPSRHRAPNPVAEARWVLRSLKRDLAAGADPLELAVILPEAEVRAFAALADEYGVPLMDETKRSLADTLPGRLLLDLLELPDHPSASRLLAIPELQPLAVAALERNVAGLEAIGALAAELQLEGLWRHWLDLLAPDEGPGAAEGAEMRWAEALVGRALPGVRAELLHFEGAGMDFRRFREHALQRAKEAASLARGAHFRAWWAALLQESFVFERPRGGVALLGATQASGRRFARAYLMRAVEGAYSARETEDYFWPEDHRAPLAEVFANLGLKALPRRFQGRDRMLFAELLSRADELVVTHPEADQGGPLVAEPALAAHARPLPPLPAGSRLELAEASRYRAPLARLELPSAGVQGLQRFDRCGFRFWAERRLPDEARPWWLALRDDLRAFGQLNDARLQELRGRHPEAASWLAEHAETLARLSFGVRLPESGAGPAARLDAASRSGAEATLVRFVAPDRVRSAAEAAEYLDGRWSELWAAGHLLRRYPGRLTRVRLVVWPLLGEPLEAYENGVTHLWRRIETRERKAAAALARLRRGEATPAPGFHCRDCRVADLCREGAR